MGSGAVAALVTRSATHAVTWQPKARQLNEALRPFVLLHASVSVYVRAYVHIGIHLLVHLLGDLCMVSNEMQIEDNILRKLNTITTSTEGATTIATSSMGCRGLLGDNLGPRLFLLDASCTRRQLLLSLGIDARGLLQSGT